MFMDLEAENGYDSTEQLVPAGKFTADLPITFGGFCSLEDNEEGMGFGDDKKEENKEENEDGRNEEEERNKTEAEITKPKLSKKGSKNRKSETLGTLLEFSIGMSALPEAADPGRQLVC
jgi:hypothetical protein